MSGSKPAGTNGLGTFSFSGSYEPRKEEGVWRWGKKVIAKADITTPASGLVLKQGDITTISQSDPFEGTSHYTQFITVWATQGFMRGYQVSILKGEVEILGWASEIDKVVNRAREVGFANGSNFNEKNLGCGIDVWVPLPGPERGVWGHCGDAEGVLCKKCGGVLD